MMGRLPLRREAGFTLVELAFVFSAVGFMWWVLAQTVARWENAVQMNLLEQKALLVAHGELSRLAALYDYADFRREAGLHGDGGLEEGRWIYRGKPDGILCPEEDESCFMTAISEDTLATKDSFPVTEVLHVSNLANSAQERNVVWISRDNDVTGELSWTLNKAVTANGTHAGPYFVTLTLHWPFRFREGVTPLQDSMGYETGNRRHTIQLRTLVGDHLSSGLTAYYPLNGDGLDQAEPPSGGIAHHGVVVNASPGTNRFDAANRGMRFTGTNSRVEVASDSTLDMTHGSYTVAFWLLPEAIPGQAVVVLAKRSPDHGWGIQMNNAGVLEVWQEGAVRLPLTNSPMGPGTLVTGWNHVAVTHRAISSGGELSLYLNGVLKARNTGGVNPQTTTAMLLIGGDESGLGVQGGMDELRLYRRTLNQSEVRALHLLGR